MTNTHPAIEARNLVKRYGNMIAINDVSLTVEPGDFITLLGPSGCGKSTLLRMIAGFIKADAGSILIGGQDVTARPPSARPINMVFQDYALFPHMNVRSNIGFGCEMQGKSRQDISARVETMLDLIQLAPLANRYPDQLSGGQRQRVALARALAPNPSALLLDEPLGALDLKLRLELQRELKALQRKTGKTFVFVTHDQEEAMSMSDLIAVMRKGKIEQLARPETIYSRPVNRYVGSFVGAANLLDGQVAGVFPDLLQIRTGSILLDLPLTALTTPGPVTPGEAVTVLIRPEDLQPESMTEAKTLRLSGKIIEKTYLGNRVHVHFQTEDGQVLLADTRAGDLTTTGEVFSVNVQEASIALLRASADSLE